MRHHTSHADTAAYRQGAFVLVVATGVILLALAFEHLGGFIPCPLCLQERYAYYAGIPLSFFGLVALSVHRPRLAGLLFAVVAVMFLVNVGVGVYHAGAEWKFWPGPATCGTIQPIGGDSGGVLDKLATTKVIKCDEAQWRFAGLSFAGWNGVVSTLLCWVSAKAAFAAGKPG